MNKKVYTLTTGLFVLTLTPLHADVKPNSLFTDNAVLQRDKVLPVFGTARDGEKVTVQFNGQKVSTVAKDGKWLVSLKPMPVNAKPQDMTIAGDNKVVIKNIVLGDVWVASGQSNMERQLGPRGGQQELPNWRQEVANANYPLIRQYYVPEHTSFIKESDAKGRWSVCSPSTAQDFTAVGYYFAKDLYKAKKIPVGILFTSWGGTPAELWTSAESISKMPDFKQAVDGLPVSIDPKEYQQKFAVWLDANEPGVKGNWQSVDFQPTSDWKSVTVPYQFDNDFDGFIWFRKETKLPNSVKEKSASISLGAIDDIDTTWINGVQVGSSTIYNEGRIYTIRPGVLKPGRNVIAVRALDTGGGGGFMGTADQIKLEVGGSSVSLAGEWISNKGLPLSQLQPMPRDPNSGLIITALYNSMIHPLTQYPIKGAIWYQGEANVGREKQYQELLPLMIADWRKSWGIGDFPFLIVQIAPFNYTSPNIREAQLLTLNKSKNTALAVTVDIGDANDIHPTHKAEVGERLALAAKVLAYGDKIEYSGPIYNSMTVKDGKVILSFIHVDSGLVAKGGGELKGFTIAGADKAFVPAKAVIKGNTVIISSESVKEPVAVRYGWSPVPDVNLFNKADLPASTFRTDVD